MISRPMVVVYHHLSAEKDPLTDLLGVSTDPDVFVQHMRYFAKNYDLISASDLMGRALPRKALLITFDDAYRSVLEVAGPILKAISAPSIFFLSAGILTANALPMDNLISLAVGQLGLAKVMSLLGFGGASAASAGDLIADYMPLLTCPQLDAASERILSLLGTTADKIRQGSGLFMDEGDVRMFPSYGMDVGNHSMTHRFFRALSPTELDREIRESREVLEKLSGRPVTCLSIPYGNVLDATGSALAVARASGHRAIFLVHGRSNGFRQMRDVFYRTSPKNTRREILPLKVRVAPVLRTVRDWMNARPARRNLRGTAT